MKILILGSSAISGGAKNIIINFYNEIRNDKKNEYIFLLSKKFLKESDNIKINITKKYNWLERIFFDYIGAKKYIKKYKPDVILSFQNTIIYFTKIRQVLYLHQPIPFQTIKNFSFLKKEERQLAFRQYILGYFINKSVKKANKIIVQTEWMRDAVIKRSKINYKKIYVIPPYLHFKNIINDNEFNLNTCNFFYPTSNLIYKNNNLILKSVEKLNDKGITNFNVELTIDGISNKNISYIGFVDYNYVINKYKTSVLIFPSYIETFGLPLLEAKMSNTIILASDTSFSHEILDDYVNAYFFNPFDKDELAELIEKVIFKKITLKKTKNKECLKNSNKIIDVVLEK